jgi:hypothetical protein
MAQKERTILPKFQSKPVTAARSRLTECIEARAALAADLIPLRESIGRLDSQADAVSAAEIALARLDAGEDHQALLWARGEGDRPQPDIEARDRLRRELEAAKASKASAERAKATISAQIEQVLSRGPDIERHATAAVAEILCEEAAPMIDSIKAGSIDLAVRIKTLQYITSRALDLSRAAGVHSGSAVALTELSRPADWDHVADAINLATDSFGVVLDKQKTTIGKWRDFESELRSDSAIFGPEAQ